MITAFITIIIAAQLLLIGHFIKKRFSASGSAEDNLNISDINREKLLFINSAAKKIFLTGYAGLIFAGLQLIVPKTALPLFFLYLTIIIPAVLIQIFLHIRKTPGI